MTAERFTVQRIEQTIAFTDDEGGYDETYDEGDEERGEMKAKRPGGRCTTVRERHPSESLHTCLFFS